MKSFLIEDSRNDLVHKSKTSDNYEITNRALGKNRYQRRLKSRVANSVQEFNNMNMNKLFKEDTIEVNVRVNGETDIYLVKVSFTGFLNSLAGFLKPDATEDDLTFSIILKSLLDAFNHGDVKIHCTCKDFQYRQAYWATVNGINSGDAETRPSDETNPNDSKGAGCKHVNLVLSNTNWMMKVASVVRNYIKYMKQHYAKKYADIIFPAIFDREYEEPVQLDMSDDIEGLADDEMPSDEETIDTSNKWARTKSQIKPGWNKNIEDDEDGEVKQIKGQQSFDIDSLDDEEDSEED